MNVLCVLNHSVAIEGNFVKVEGAEELLIKEVISAGHEVSIAAIQGAPKNPNLPGRLEIAKVPFIRLNRHPHDQSGRRWRVINYATMLGSMGKVIRGYDLVYVFFPGHSGRIAIVWSLFHKVDYALYVRGSWYKRSSLLSWFSAQAFRNAKFILATGEAFQSQLSKYNDSVVNEVPLLSLSSYFDGTTLAGANSERPVALFVGRLEREKGVLDLLEAIGTLNYERQIELEVRIIGAGNESELEEFNTTVTRLGIRHIVTYVGFVSSSEELAAEYSNASMFVFPSYYPEGFPRVYYEATAFGLPIITCPLPGTEGFLIDGKNCLMCRPRDPVDLSFKIHRLLMDKDLAGSLRRNARNTYESAAAGFSYLSHAQQFLALLPRSPLEEAAK